MTDTTMTRDETVLAIKRVMLHVWEQGERGEEFHRRVRRVFDRITLEDYNEAADLAWAEMPE